MGIWMNNETKRMIPVLRTACQKMASLENQLKILETSEVARRAEAVPFEQAVIGRVGKRQGDEQGEQEPIGPAAA